METETETVVASEEVNDETVGETETSESNEGTETTEVADASGENDQGTSEAIEEGGSSETSARNEETSDFLFRHCIVEHIVKYRRGTYGRM